MEELEAKKWITENWVDIDDETQDGVFAGHVFNTKEEALKFIEKLYELGAQRVLVGDIKSYSQNEPNRPYSDELIIDLPEDSITRQEIFTFLNASEPSEQYQETGQKTIAVFWDY